MLTIRTIEAEYLIAMKLRSGRQYKSDFSDVLGILAAHEKQGQQIVFKQIQEAVSNLYGDWDSLPKSSQEFISNVMQDGHFSKLYAQAIIKERETQELLVEFTQSYPGVVKKSNADDVVENLQKKANLATVLAQLKERKSNS